jgi:hypothetical protein
MKIFIIETAGISAIYLIASTLPSTDGHLHLNNYIGLAGLIIFNLVHMLWRNKKKQTI